MDMMKPMIQVKIEEPFITAVPIEISQLQEEEKIPQENIKIVSDLKHIGANAPNLKCTIRRDFESSGKIFLKVMGEYRGTCSTDLMLFIMVYNEENDLIDYSANIDIGKGFVDQESFSELVEIPKDERISQIVLRFVKKIF